MARGDTRRRMLGTAIELIHEGGAGGVTVDAVLGRSHAPRGSVYHHFPGGRDQIVREAAAMAADAMTSVVAGLAELPPVQGLRAFVGVWKEMLSGSDFQAGCPVAAVTVSGTTADPELLELVAATFAEWKSLCAAALRRSGIDDAEADRISTMAVASIEGAIIMCRAARSLEPLDVVGAELEDRVTGALAARRG